jgi:hypothetical protein
MTHQIIGLTGYAGSGKDEVRTILEDVGFVGMSFAAPLKSMLQELLTSCGLSDNWMFERNLKESVIPALGVSYRLMAQTLGDWGRNMHADFWIRLADQYQSDISAQEHTAVFCVSDVRFTNEAAWVRENDGVIWRIHRPGLEPVRAHVSESEMDGITPDVTIHNTGTLDDLRTSVLAALEAAA